MNTVKSQCNESFLVAQLWEKLSYLESDQKASEQIAEEYIAESEVHLIQHENIIHKDTTQKLFSFIFF